MTDETDNERGNVAYQEIEKLLQERLSNNRIVDIQINIDYIVNKSPPTSIFPKWWVATRYWVTESTIIFIFDIEV